MLFLDLIDRPVNSFIWSPDSTRLFFTVIDRGRQPIQFVNINGGGARVAVSGSDELSHLAVSMNNMLAALQTKQVDGFAMAPPWVHKPLLDGEAVMVASGPDGDPAELMPFANTLLATKPDTCVKRKALCEGVGRAFRDAASIMLDRPTEALALLKKRFPQFDDRQIAAAFEDVRKITPRDLRLTAEAFEKAERFNVAAGLLKPDETLKSYDGFFTDQFVK